jgi:tetratricopeptide (TPR) repeat protein
MWSGRKLRSLSAGLILAAAGAAAPLEAQQTADTLTLYRALELEGAGKYREAAPLFRAALRIGDPVNALLGLERVYAELGWADSLLKVVDSLVVHRPADATVRAIQLRTLQALGRDGEIDRVVEQWARESAGDPAPYREHARLLLQRGRASAAAAVIERARQTVGSTKDLEMEVAQVRAAMGQWESSAEAWRGALARASYLEQAAVYALVPTPAARRDSVRRIFLAPPINVASRLALAGLEAAWGSPREGWLALRDLPADSVSAAAWLEFAARAERDERWTLARDAFVATLQWRRTPEVALRAANAALSAGDAQAVLVLAPLAGAGGDSARVARSYVPLHVRALAALGRANDAERLAARYERWMTPGQRNAMTRAVAFGWVRAGQTARARAALSAAGAEGDSSDAAGWLALYEGDLKTARALLRAGTETTPELALAMGLVARVRADSAPTIGQAFIALARADSALAARRFAEAVAGTPEAASLLMLISARLHAARGDEAQAVTLWRRVAEGHATTPEAPEAELEWARVLIKQGQVAAGVARLEHMILTYPESALVPQARRELDSARRGIPDAA